MKKAPTIPVKTMDTFENNPRAETNIVSEIGMNGLIGFSFCSVNQYFIFKFK